MGSLSKNLYLLPVLGLIFLWTNWACTPPRAKLSEDLVALAASDIIDRSEVRPLPGQLDSVPMFNSNSPEWLKKEGILLSTFPPKDKKYPLAHLNYGFNGRFDIFVHHQTHTPPDLQTFYLGVIVFNPGKKSITLNVLQAASYLTANAPYKVLDDYIENADNKTYSGPGDAAANDVLQGKRHKDFPEKLIVPPGESRLLLNHPMPVKDLEKPINGRSTIIRVRSNGKAYVASLAMFAKKNADGSDRAPTLAEWQNLLNTGNLATPRDKTPTPPDQKGGQLIYSRVAGVASGSRWQAQLTDPNSKDLTLPEIGKSIAYGIATLRGGTLGTQQIQTAKLLVRYPDTAYEAHGNYAVEYNLTLPLYNPSQAIRKVKLTLATPIKEEILSQGGLRFRQPSLDFPFFRGTVRLKYADDRGKSVTNYIHLWHRSGKVLSPLLTLNLAPQSRRQVKVDFIYPPDSTPPQILKIETE
jgi:hypothetical protein